jgi:hypothetical protein
LALQGQAPTTADVQLQQYVKDLQSSAADLKIRREIREKIIKLVATMPSPPALPDEAEKHGFKAEYLAKSAQTAADFAKVADEYGSASNIAPWVAQYYENWAIALDKANGLEYAKDKFELYLIAAPNATDRTDVRRKIAELEVRLDEAASQAKADAESQAQAQASAAAAAQASDERRRLNAPFEGHAWDWRDKSNGVLNELRFNGGFLEWWRNDGHNGWMKTQTAEPPAGSLNFTLTTPSYTPTGENPTHDTYTFSAASDLATIRVHWHVGYSGRDLYFDFKRVR